MKNTTPVIDPMFDLEQTIKDYGFSIDEKDGVCVAHGVSHWYYGAIQIEFNQAFVSHYQTDMKVTYREGNEDRVLFLGIAPTNYPNFDTLMQLILPSEDFIKAIESSLIEKLV